MQTSDNDEVNAVVQSFAENELASLDKIGSDGSRMELFSENFTITPPSSVGTSVSGTDASSEKLRVARNLQEKELPPIADSKPNEKPEHILHEPTEVLSSSRSNTEAKQHRSTSLSDKFKTLSRKIVSAGNKR